MSNLIWNPQKLTLIKIKSSNHKKAFKVFRSSSSAYISRADIRILVLNKNNNKCSFCGSKEKLEIDHINSVYSSFIKNDFHKCNSIENLQVLCKKCNTSKKP